MLGNRPLASNPLMASIQTIIPVIVRRIVLALQASFIRIIQLQTNMYGPDAVTQGYDLMSKQRQNVEISGGDTVSLQFPLADSLGGPAILTNPTGTWKLSKSLTPADVAFPVLSKSVGDGVRLTQEMINSVLWWVAYVDLTEDDTRSLSGKYTHQLRILDVSSKLISASGTLSVIPLIT